MIRRRIPILLISLGVLLLFLSLVPLSMPLKNSSHRYDASNWKLPVPSAIPPLNPQQIIAPADKSLALLVFSRLVRTDEYMEVLPDLLENWSFDLGQSLATLRIREGLKFHDSSPVTADDIVFSFHVWAKNTGLDNNLLFLVKGAQEYATGKARRITGVTVLNPRTLHVRLLQPAPEQFVAHLAQPRFCVYPNAFGGRTEEAFFKRPTGTGPFRLVSYEPERAEFTANENYHLGRPRLNSVTALHLGVDSALEAFKTGELDNLIMFQTPNPALLKGPGIVVKRLPRASTLTAILNNNHPDFKDENVRQTVARALQLNKHLVAEKCFPGSDVATSYIPPGFVGHVPTNIEDVDMGAAPQKLRLSVPLTFYASPSENGQCVVDVLTGPLDSIGVQASTKEVPQLFEMLKKGKAHLWAETFAFKSDEAYYNLRYYASSSPEFLLGVPVPFLDQTFSRLSVPGLSQLERGHLYSQMDNHLIDHAHIVPIAHFSEAAVYRSRVKNLEFLITGRFAANWHQIEVRRTDEEKVDEESL